MMQSAVVTAQRRGRRSIFNAAFHRIPGATTSSMTRAGINVQRGLWRSRIFATVLWVIGTAALAYMALPARRLGGDGWQLRADVADGSTVTI
jgi:hypothetical protein